MQYQEKYFEHGHDKLRYFQIGAGKPILFLHGGGVRALTYKKIIDLLAKKYLVIAPDLPCFGKSSCPNDVSDYSRILEKLIKSLNSKKIAIIGHSLGGAVALQLSSSNTNVPLLVLVDSAGISRKVSKTKFLYKFFVEKTIRDIFKYKNLKTLSLIVKDFFGNVFKRFFECCSTIKIVKAILFTDFLDYKNIKSKTLILWGDKDEIFSKTIAESFYQKIKGSELKIVDGNHDWCLFRPEKFSEIVVDWLGKNSY